jgi:hypothetical protein
MPWYDLTAFERTAGGPLRENREHAAAFEAVDVEAARNEAAQRAKTLPAGHVAVLYATDDVGPSRVQLGTWDSPRA